MQLKLKLFKVTRVCDWPQKRVCLCVWGVRGCGAGSVRNNPNAALMIHKDLTNPAGNPPQVDFKQQRGREARTHPEKESKK